jgi:hypothetical protein
MISGYAHAVYDRILSGWRKQNFVGTSHTGRRVETVWMNYEPSVLHDTRYLGHTYRERQSIKRKRLRWIAKFRVEPLGLQQAVLDDLGRVFAEHKLQRMPPAERSSDANRPSFVPWDIEIARLNFGANCGPSCFAATTGREVCRVMCHFSHFLHCQWTNLTQMRRAFHEAGYSTEVCKGELPARGVALIQWLGPWTEKDFYSRWSLHQTHWVAVQGGWVFDHTVGRWQTLQCWQDETVPEFIATIPRASGWATKYGVEVKRLISSWLGSGSLHSHSSSGAALNLSG